MKMTEQINELVTALAKAQGAMEDAGKDALNPHFKTRYADLAAVRKASRKPLSENGLIVTQLCRTSEGCVEVETILAHTSGQYISDVLRMPVPQFTPQGIGSAFSYAKRYAMMGALGLAASDDDDDGESSMARNGNGRPEPVKPVPAKPTVARSAWATQGNGKAKPVDPAAMLRDKARGMAREGRTAFDTWWATLTDEQCNEVNVIAEELAEIAYAVDQAELASA